MKRDSLDAGLYTHMWPLPLTREGVMEAQQAGTADPALAQGPLTRLSSSKRLRDAPASTTSWAAQSKASSSSVPQDS